MKELRANVATFPVSCVVVSSHGTVIGATWDAPGVPSKCACDRSPPIGLVLQSQVHVLLVDATGRATLRTLLETETEWVTLRRLVPSGERPTVPVRSDL